MQIFAIVVSLAITAVGPTGTSATGARLTFTPARRS